LIPESVIEEKKNFENLLNSEIIQKIPEKQDEKNEFEETSAKKIDSLNIIHPESHPHAHVNYCGHQKILYKGHVEYLHDGELHREIENGDIK